MVAVAVEGVDMSHRATKQNSAKVADWPVGVKMTEPDANC